MKWLVDIIKKLMDDKFTGSIQVNFYHGGITNVVEQKSYKPPVIVGNAVIGITAEEIKQGQCMYIGEDGRFYAVK